MNLREVDPGGIQGKSQGMHMIKTHCVHVRSTQRIDKKPSLVNPKEIKILHVFITTATMLLSCDVLSLCV